MSDLGEWDNVMTCDERSVLKGGRICDGHLTRDGECPDDEHHLDPNG